MYLVFHVNIVCAGDPKLLEWRCHTGYLLLRSPAMSLGFTTLGEIFAYAAVFNLTIEVVTFRLCGWCMLCVFMLPASTSLGHVRIFESKRWNACVHWLDLCSYSHPKEFWGNGVRNHVNSKGKIPSAGGSSDAESGRTVSPTHYQLSYSGPTLRYYLITLKDRPSGWPWEQSIWGLNWLWLVESYQQLRKRLL